MAIGVDITTSLRSGPANAGTRSARFHIAGLTERGPIDKAVLVKSLAQFEQVLGGRTPYTANVYDTARLFWEEGGSELIVSRSVGPAAVAGSLVLLDRADNPTVRIEAASVGSYSTALSIEVSESSTDLDRFTVTVREDGEVVSILRNLDSPAALVSALNSNPYVNAKELGSPSSAPSNNPHVIAATDLGAGSDDRSGMKVDHVVAALELPGVEDTGAAVALPGYPLFMVGDQLIAHAKAHHKTALLADEAGVSPAVAITDASELISRDGEYAGVFYPHVVVPDGSGTRTLSPEGYVAAVRARAHVGTGFWQAPPGEAAAFRWAVGTDIVVDQAMNNTLNEGQVNGIVTFSGKSRLYGWSSLAADRENFSMLSARDTLNNLRVLVKEALDPYVFATIDGRGHLMSKVEAAVVGVLDPIASAGGFYARVVDGEDVDSGYAVIVDETNNTAATLGENELRVSVSVRLSPLAALIRGEIIKVALSAAV